MDGNALNPMLKRAQQALQFQQWPEAEHLARKIVADGASSADALLVLAEALFRQGKLEDLARLADRPDLPVSAAEAIISFLGALYWQRGMRAQSADCSRRILALDPTNASAFNNLGIVHMSAGEWKEAANCFRQACRSDPSRADFLMNYARSCDSLGRALDTAKAYRKVLGIKPKDPAALMGLAEIQFRRADAISVKSLLRRERETTDSMLAEAEHLANQVIRLEPANKRAKVLNASILQRRGEHARAVSELETLISDDPYFAPPYWILAEGKKFSDADRRYLPKMESMAHDPSRAPNEQMLLLSALGKAYDDLGEHATAMARHDEGHALQRTRMQPFDGNTYVAQVNEIIARFDSTFFASTKDIANDSELPVFVIGMPRSGTTLIEQILSSHPDVFGAGELPFWPTYARFTLDRSGNAKPTFTKRLVDLYLRLLESLDPDAKRVVDKNPFNTELIGIIHALLPRARILFCRRNAIDNALSLYAAHFLYPPGYVNRKEDLVLAFHQNRRLLQHFRQVIPGDRFMEVRYEEAVSDTETTARKLIDFCGLEWDDRCLHPEQNVRRVLTASQWQVRQPVYKTSVDRWKRYEGHLGPLQELVGM